MTGLLGAVEGAVAVAKLFCHSKRGFSMIDDNVCGCDEHHPSSHAGVSSFLGGSARNPKKWWGWRGNPLINCGLNQQSTHEYEEL